MPRSRGPAAASTTWRALAVDDAYGGHIAALHDAARGIALSIDDPEVRTGAELQVTATRQHILALELVNALGLGATAIALLGLLVLAGVVIALVLTGRSRPSAGSPSAGPPSGTAPGLLLPPPPPVASRHY